MHILIEPTLYKSTPALRVRRSCPRTGTKEVKVGLYALSFCD
uniref:Uncharacterized protein n=1 Tax=Rhizophora mucronata TaxID=61149 RepID=A0A2P2Q8Q1_RHIMU